MNARSTSPRSKPQSMRMRMKEEARAAILDAAEQVLAEQGQAARMDDIAARVGVSVGTLYNYFEDRQQLLTALREQRGRELLALLDAELERTLPLPYRARLHGFLRCILEYSQTHFRLFSLLLEDSVRRDASREEELERHLAMWREAALRLEHLGQQGIREGALRPEDAPHYPALLLDMMHGLVVRQLLAKQPAPSDELLAPLLRCFLEGAAPR
ncbi:MAG TPA: TetR/AcrR family transcriptional regulator [Archangium sp.]|uniref:TetR/AcrR family transcriptional regulator n=1 Tax=Archangium sp. TaxID=1872627 RepID=UPI002E338963|nr:TetR/AcrR family transcriptional regulator [Archangium sp.]HEX5747331.1 TetR/AcrR family transcriptional regulator [Archangium sp.]